MKTRKVFVLGVSTSLAVLLIARSVIMPAWASQFAPLLAAVVLLMGCFPHIQRFRVPALSLPLLILVLVYVGSSTASGSFDNFAKATSIGSLWLLAFIAGANLRDSERAGFLSLVVIASAIEVVFAVGETIFGLAEIRSSISATQDGAYIVRPNTILGAWTNRAQATIGYPIPFAHLLSIALAVVIFGRFRLRLPGRIFLGSFFFLGILLTGTRSGVAAAFVCVFFGVFSSLRGRLSSVKILVSAMVGLIGIVTASLYADQETFSVDGSYTHRIGVLTSVAEIFRLPAEQVLFGSGINSHEALFQAGYLGTSGTFAVDNSFVTLLIYSGIVGLGSFLILLLAALRRGSPLEVSILMGFVTFGISYDFINWHLLAFFCFLILGVSSTQRIKPVMTLSRVQSAWHSPSKRLEGQL